MSDGPRCANGHLQLAYVYDANGWERWCAVCGVSLNRPANLPAKQPARLFADRQEARLVLWPFFLIEFGWLWAQLPDTAWRIFVTGPAFLLALIWFRDEWKARAGHG